MTARKDPMLPQPADSGDRLAPALPGVIDPVAVISVPFGVADTLFALEIAGEDQVAMLDDYETAMLVIRHAEAYEFIHLLDYALAMHKSGVGGRMGQIRLPMTKRYWKDVRKAKGAVIAVLKRQMPDFSLERALGGT